jgi:hypothetical protein
MTMALQGTLREYSLGQLLNLIHIARKSGGLSVQSAQGGADLFFDEGKLVAANMGQPQTLTDLMVQAGRLSAEQASALVVSSGSVDDKQLGLLLLNTGQISRDDIVQTLRQNMLNVVQAVWSWEDGTFAFDQTRTPPAGRVTIPVGLERILLEGNLAQKQPEPKPVQPPPPVAVVETAQVVEATQPVEPEEPSSAGVGLKFTEGFGERMRSVNLNPKDWKVISAIKPGNTIADIAQQTRMSEDEVGEIVARLMEEGLVEVAGAPESAPATAELGLAPVPDIDTEYSVAAVHDSHATEEPEPAMAGAEPQAKQGVVKRFLSRFGKG